ncbi:hypothetical protein [Asanoa sp. NPDC050611]|uniref:DUF7402 domain-containing protein n=1 Tax=Asanoa sp. NPDC050611 TaxID=3157098 RepID=UPI0033DEADFA
MHRARTALVAALALTATFAVATPASADGENLALAATATAISSAAGYTPAGANDGVIPVITTPADEWASNEQQNGVWLRLTWSSPQTLSQVKLYDRSFTFTSNILGGTLSFSDGSTVSVGALPEDGQTPATVNFAARSVTWVQFTVTAVTPGSWAAVGLAEFEAYGEGGPPPTGDCPAGIYPMHKVSVLDPAYGATVSGANVTIRICAPGMGNVWARSWHQPDAAHPDAKGYDRRFQNVAPDATGYATLTFPASEYPRGPIAVLIDAWDGVEGSGTFTVTDTAYLQLHNTGGTSWNEGAPAGVPAAAGGKSLAFVDDFDGSLSISRTGAGATYASAKPDGPNGTEFGDGIFADFTGPYNPFATLSNEYLRIRASKTPPGYVDPMGWGRQYFTGNLSSARTDGTGIAYQYGYFEARILMPSAPGTWSSLWLMSLNSLPTGARSRCRTPA